MEHLCAAVALNMIHDAKADRMNGHVRVLKPGNDIVGDERLRRVESRKFAAMRVCG